MNYSSVKNIPNIIMNTNNENIPIIYNLHQPLRQTVMEKKVSNNYSCKAYLALDVKKTKS